MYVLHHNEKIMNLRVNIDIEHEYTMSFLKIKHLQQAHYE